MLDIEGLSWAQHEAHLRMALQCDKHYPTHQVSTLNQKCEFVLIESVTQLQQARIINVNGSYALRTVGNALAKVIHQDKMYFVTYDEMVEMVGEDKMAALKRGEKLEGGLTWEKYCSPDVLSVEQLCKKHNVNEKEAAKYQKCIRKTIATYSS